MHNITKEQHLVAVHDDSLVSWFAAFGGTTSVLDGRSASSSSTSGRCFDLPATETELLLWSAWYSPTSQQPIGHKTLFTNAKQDLALAFVTVHDAGHEVPDYQPQNSLELFRSFIQKDLFQNPCRGSSHASRMLSLQTRGPLFDEINLVATVLFIMCTLLFWSIVHRKLISFS